MKGGRCQRGRVRIRRLGVAVLVLALAACSTPHVSGPPTAVEESARLHDLLHVSDEALLDRNPMTALYRGDLRRAARHGDYVSRAYVEAERRAAEADLAGLALIARGRLSAIDQVAYDTFKWKTQEWRERHSPPAASIWPLTQLDQINGWHLFFPDLSSGEGVAPYRTVADYENGLSRIDGFIDWLELVVDRMREGQRAGVVLPRVLAEHALAQFDRFATQGIADSPYYGPIRKLPPDMPEAERERLARAYAAKLEDGLLPAFRRVRRFLAEEYLPSTRPSVAVSALPGGAAYYDFLIRSNTTTRMTADEIHRLGLSEVKRISGGMGDVMRRVGFKGTMSQFFVHLRSDPRFAPASAEDLSSRYADIGGRVADALPRLFWQMPNTPLEIRPMPGYQATNDAGARYTPGSVDTGQPAVFHFNTFNLQTRRTWSIETLYLHEAVPGHHLQIALAAENETLPKMLRFDGNTAYWEGWALYAESLGPELGLFGDPYQLFGYYDGEMLRAMRLVVDTGIHAKGWSRERAIDYMLEHSAMSLEEATIEVERYIADPGQALAYKVGALTMQRLRQRAQQALGDRFDVRAFHAQVLGTGSIPLAVLEAKIERWIASH
jgi:uncharacterized protein (DUF885 family)